MGEIEEITVSPARSELNVDIPLLPIEGIFLLITLSIFYLSLFC